MNTAMQMPRFRTDLVTTPVEEAGQRFIDVTDPDSGSTFRFYEVEYAIACAMEGNLDVDGLAKWALEELGLETSPGELETVITTLEELGYLEGGPAAPPASADAEVEPAEIELGAPGGPSSVVEPMPVAVAAAADLELGAPGKSLIAPSRPVAPPAESIELGTPGMAASASAGPPLVAPADDQSFEGLLDDEPPTAVRPAPVRDDAPTAIRPAPPPDDFGLDGLTPPPAEVPSAKLRPVTEHPAGDDDGPTNLPPAVPGLADDEPEVSVDLSEHLSIDASDVKEAVRQSQVMTAVNVPEELLAELGETTPDEDLEISVETGAPAGVDAAGSRPIELPEKPVKVSKPKPKPEARPAVEAEEAPVAPKQKSGATGFLLFLLLLAAGGGGAYWYFKIYKPGLEEKAAGPTAPVNVQRPVTPPTPPKPATIKGAIEKRTAESSVVTLAKGGQVVFLIEDGAQVSAGDVVARIKGFERFERKIKEVSDRRDYYQRKLDKAKEKLDAGDQTQQKNVDAFTRKVEEKAGKIKEYEDDLAQHQLTAPVAGTVKVVGKEGWAKEGVALVEIGGPSSLFAVFTVPAEKSLAEGATVQVAAADKPDAASDCQVVVVSAPKVTVECQLDSGLPESGDVILK